MSGPTTIRDIPVVLSVAWMPEWAASGRPPRRRPGGSCAGGGRGSPGRRAACGVVKRAPRPTAGAAGPGARTGQRDGLGELQLAAVGFERVLVQCGDVLQQPGRAGQAAPAGPVPSPVSAAIPRPAAPSSRPGWRSGSPSCRSKASCWAASWAMAVPCCRNHGRRVPARRLIQSYSSTLVNLAWWNSSSCSALSACRSPISRSCSAIRTPSVSTVTCWPAICRS